jgi:hypothetical protein
VKGNKRRRTRDPKVPRLSISTSFLATIATSFPHHPLLLLHLQPTEQPLLRANPPLPFQLRTCVRGSRGPCFARRFDERAFHTWAVSSSARPHLAPSQHSPSPTHSHHLHTLLRSSRHQGITTPIPTPPARFQPSPTPTDLTSTHSPTAQSQFLSSRQHQHAFLAAPAVHKNEYN